MPKESGECKWTYSKWKNNVISSQIVCTEKTLSVSYILQNKGSKYVFKCRSCWYFILFGENEIIRRLLWKPAAAWLKSLFFPFTAYSITSVLFLSKVYWFGRSYFSSLFGTWCRKYFSNVINCSSNPWCFKELFSVLWTDLLPVSSERKGILTL